MRTQLQSQPQFSYLIPRNAVGNKLQKISDVLYKNKHVLDNVFNDIIKDNNAKVGRKGLNADQVLRCAILKTFMNYTYEQLEFHLVDSTTIRSFARMNYFQYPKKSALQANIKAISAETWESINSILIVYALTNKIETGTMTRTDATAVDTNIHEPRDSTLLQDGIRVITAILSKAKEICPDIKFSDHNRAAKKRVLNISSSKAKKRQSAYKKLLGLAHQVVQYSNDAISLLKACSNNDFETKFLAEQHKERLQYNLDMLHQVIDQTTRRVIHKESVPAEQKLVSFFEPHTDIIKKDNRDVHYGHKVFLATGKSGLIIDCIIPRGNPNDTTMVETIVERQQQVLQKTPRQMVFDGGFASKDNLDKVKAAGVKDACFPNKRGLNIKDMVKSNWVYKKLRRFRAGIEAIISAVKRAFGLSRCTWKGWSGFQQYVWASVVTFNLQVLASS